MKKKLVYFAKFAVTAFLLYYLFKTRDIKLADTWAYIRSSDLLLVSAALALLVVGQYLCTIRWSAILEHLGIRIARGRLFSFYLIGMFFSNFFPSIVGGDFVKIFYVKRDSGKSLTVALTSVYLDRATGFVALLAFGIAGSLLYPISLSAEYFRPVGWLGLDSVPLWVISVGLAVAFVAVNLVLFSSHLYKYVARPLRWMKKDRLAEKLFMIRDAMQVFRFRPSGLVMPTAVSFVNIAIVVAMNYLIAVALGLHVSAVAMAAVVSVMSVIVMLPVSINGVGVRETAFVLLLLPVTGPGTQERIVALSLINFLLTVLSSLPGSVCYSLLKKEIATQDIGKAIDEP